jgi:glutamyl-tRNA synthetase
MAYSDDLIARLFPKDLMTIAELEQKYPQRVLSEDAIVTRFCPSPTGFMHIGGVYIANIAKNLARHSNGNYFIRIEDTDQNRKVDDFEDHFNKTFDYFGIESDESDEKSSWGPYTQSHREEIYLSCIKDLMKKGKAYPCFCTKETLEEQTNKQREAKVDMGYYGPWATCRNLSAEEVNRKLDAGESYVIRFRSEGVSRTIEFNDEIRGNLKMNDNINDVVILKSSASELPLPTYHMAHAVDDHLMRVNLVLRAEEWLPSVPIHLQLFDSLGFDRIKYAHIAPLMKLDGSSKRKLSKRKDPEASVGYYMEQGYPSKAVLVYLKGLANSRLADMPAEECLAEAIHVKELPKAGALMDMEKLNDISSNYVGTLSAEQIREAAYNWAKEHDADLVSMLDAHWDFSLKAIDADRFNNGKIRKDLFRWSDFKMLYSFFIPERFELVTNAEDERLQGIKKEVVQKLAAEFVANYEEGADNMEWFENIKQISTSANFAVNNKEYKAEPEKFSGNLQQATHILRVAITGRSSSPGLGEVCHILGKDEVVRRVKALL